MVEILSVDGTSSPGFAKDKARRYRMSKKFEETSVLSKDTISLTKTSNLVSSPSLRFS